MGCILEYIYLPMQWVRKSYSPNCPRLIYLRIFLNFHLSVIRRFSGNCYECLLFRQVQRCQSLNLAGISILVRRRLIIILICLKRHLLFSDWVVIRETCGKKSPKVKFIFGIQEYETVSSIIFHILNTEPIPVRFGKILL